ncbi:MAG: UDP-N-acetylmuramate dehydrogenase, partial [Pyrinomonadaceae bacterium]
SNSELGTRNSELITVAAGEDWDEFVAHCVDHDLAGVECLSGIPGFVGGTPVQNVGAYGQEVSETIVSVRCFDRKTREFVTLVNAECGFTYRTSIFNSTMRDRYIVSSVTFALQHGGEAKIVYKDLIEHFNSRQPSLRETREAVLAVRRSKSMVIDPADPNSKSSGSFFKNPVIEKEMLAEIRRGFERVPSFDFGDKVKIPAAWLIENAGFDKGFKRGNAGISTNHTLALINRGNASADEMISLKNQIQNAVKEKFGITLQPEPVFVGF